MHHHQFHGLFRANNFRVRGPDECHQGKGEEEKDFRGEDERTIRSEKREELRTGDWGLEIEECPRAQTSQHYQAQQQSAHVILCKPQ